MIRRIEELRCIQVRFFKEPQANYGIITSIIVHLLRNVSFAVPAKHPHLTEALRDLSYEGIIQRFGMFFLQDLDPVTGELSLIAQMDNADVAFRLASHVKKNKKSKNPSRPHLVQRNTEVTLEYPLGEWPTWKEITHCLDKDPLRIVRPWRFHSLRAWDEYTSDLFIAFTNDMWLALDPSRLQNHLVATTTLAEAMQSWSVTHAVQNLFSVRFLPNSHGLEKNTKQCWDFAGLLEVFFPDVDALPSKAVWRRFSHRHGYLHTYSEYKATLSAEQFLNLTRNLAELLGHAQCLPNSTKASNSSHGRLWTGSHGTIDMRTNSKSYKLKGIGNAKQTTRKVMRINLPSHQVATRLDEAQGISTRASTNQQRQQRRSARSKRNRNPPLVRDEAHDGD